MRKIIWVVVSLIAALFITCTTRDGEIVSFKPSFGSVFVSTSVPGARVFLDYKDTGKTTPALINDVRVGRHVVHIWLSRHQPDDGVDSVIVDVKEGAETSLHFELINVPNVGNLKVTTSPDSALVLINKLEFGYTPLEVTGLLTGDYTVRIIKGGFESVVNTVQITQNQITEISESLILKPRLVLFEHFSNTDCIPCVDVDVIIEDVLHQLGPDQIISLGYHPNFPGPSDPFYLAAKPENDDRRVYYGGLFPIPYALIDGTRMIPTAPLSQLEQNILNAFDAQRLIAPKAVIEILDLQTVVDTLSGRAKVTALENLGTEVHLRIALINRSVEMSPPPGINGQTHFFDVMRDMYPNAQGTPVSLSANGSQSVPFEFVRQSDWEDDLEVVAFVQDDATKEVLQSAWTVSP